MRTTFRCAAALLLVVGFLCGTPAPAHGRPPVNYDVIENIEPLLTANFTTDLNAIVADKGAVILTSAVTVYKRELSPLFAGRGAVLPGIGLWIRSTLTNARRQTKRDNLHMVIYDYLARGNDAVKLQTQLELAAEAILRTVDRTYQAGGGVWGSGELDRSVSVQFVPVVQPKGRGFFEGRLMVSAPVNEEDTGLPAP